MAITPRTIFSSPASATVATISLLAFSAVGTLAYKVAQDSHAAPTQIPIEATAGESCSGISEVLGPDRTYWSETDWLVYSTCFEQKNNARMASSVAAQGLHYYPESEALYNVQAYNQIVLGEHAEAVETLEEGLQSVSTPTNGVMENNLAWAGLWVPRQMDRQRARVLYKRALRHNPNSCEMLHTGLWVEYAIAREARGVEKYHALKSFLDLRQQYEPCQQRAAAGDWKTLTEVIGATVLFRDVDENLMAPHHSRAFEREEQDGAAELRDVTDELRDRYRGVSIDALCREAMPLANTHHMCVSSVQQAIDQLEAPTLKAHDPATDDKAVGGGGSGCKMVY